MILIKKDKAIKETWEEPSYSDPLNVLTEIRDRLKALPTIEIVRCKDCKHLSVRSSALGVYQCAIHGDYPSGEYFCADGERRQDG